MQKPILRYVARRHTRLELPMALLLLPGKDGALVIQNVDEAAQHAGERPTGAQRKAGRHERRIALEATRAVTHDA